MPVDWIGSVSACFSDCTAASRSQHFCLLLDLAVVIPRRPKVQIHRRVDLAARNGAPTRERFCHTFFDRLLARWDDASAECLDAHVNAAMLAAAQDLPTRAVERHRPWISSRTLEMIELRNRSRTDHSPQLEHILKRQVRQAAKVDRGIWLSNMLDKGEWCQVRKLRKSRAHQQGRLRDLSGVLIDNDTRSETMAVYLEKVQWAVHFADAVPESRQLFSAPLDIQDTACSPAEIRLVITHLQRGKASGDDNMAAEFWQALLSNEGALDALTALCNACLAQKTVPQDWRKASVVTLFKKGDTSLPSNYRPISLLAVGYKVLASLLLRRIKKSGSERRISGSQYGFRPERGTADALFLARRIVDATLEDRAASLYMVLLDWSKAFDRIKHDALLQALSRFGIRGLILDLISQGHLSRAFFHSS